MHDEDGRPAFYSVRTEGDWSACKVVVTYTFGVGVEDHEHVEVTMTRAEAAAMAAALVERLV